MDRKRQLNKRFLDILSGSTDVERHKALFLEGLSLQDDPAACVSKIVESKHGLSAVQQAIRHDLSTRFMNGLGTNVINYLLRANDVGDILDTVLLHILSPPIFWNTFCEFEKGNLDENAESVFAQFLAYLLRMENTDTSCYRDRAKQPSIFNRLVGSDHPEVRAATNLIKEILSTASVTSALSTPEGPGGRHDNDFMNFRDISIVPTVNEIQCTKKAFYRHASLLDDPTAKETRIADYLDNTFRLLRADMLYQLKEELQPILTKDNKKKRQRGTVIEGLCVRRLQNIKDSDRMTALKDPRGSKFLSYQSLACLIADGQLLTLGTILRVEDLLVKKPPAVVFQICGEASFVKALPKLNTAKEVKLVQTNTAIYSFEPVFRVLQTMKIVPLAEEILFWENGIPIGSPSIIISKITILLARNPSMDIQPLLGTQTPIKLDQAQAVSLLTGLNQRVSLIQGPPGTGKSFIGALLAKALHDFFDQTILVVCYTNHALDQFLEDLLEIGIPGSSIARLGGRANSAVSQLSLKNQTKEKFLRSNAAWTIIDNLKERADFLRDVLETTFRGFLASDISFEDMLTYIEFEDTDYSDAFRVPESMDGMIRKLADWKLAVHRSLVDDIWKHGRDYDECQDELSRKFSESSVAVLKQKRIIGCTTTGAAKYTEDIRAASPGVLLVEEAGEILESHIITALGKNTTQMILIGDHKQLRPKVNNYELTVEKEEGYDLNRSLFERLHRIRPEISALIRELAYPGLTDAPKTQNRDNIRGIQSNVVFVDHNQDEDDEKRISDRGDGGSLTSKRNQFEVDMVMKIVHYLLQQGYRSENIVLLTPYLGQLSALRDAIKKDADALMNKLDSGELTRAGLLASPTPPAKSQKTRIRLATIGLCNAIHF
ncbi:P-loop containing nucleoside triphosphate hydrolase protein [Butyriboletus roseoflavus]|nr:P-loop containing nucleoside triphosphate hydrolase protein [Butyriboletus roseoflavus]